MKKFIFTLLLAIVSSVWMMSNAFCMVAKTPVDGQTVSISGVLIQTAMPCGDEEPCANCLTLALSANEDLYYLSTTDPVVERQLDSIMSELVSVNCICEQPAVVTGVLYMRGGFHYIAISSITVLGDIQPKNEDLRLNSLCDEWNVLEHLAALGPDYESFSTLHFRLTTDTIINATRYVKLEQDGIYKGAMREGTNADIYYVPNHSTNEYLLYAFNAQVGDSLENLWFGANEIDRFIIKSATVVNIESTMPRKFTIGFEWQSVYSYAAINDTSDIMYAELVWLEGVGFQYGGPLNYECPFDCAGAPGMLILCAYKNGEQVYTSDLGKKYGCEYNREEKTDPMFPSDTRWHYVYEEMYGGPDFTRIYFSDSPIDTVINNTHYQRIKGKLFRSEGAKVWCTKDSMGTLVERLVYDFDLQVGDSIRNIFYEDDPYDVIPSYAKVTKVENITLSDGRYARRLSYDAFRYDDIEHIGSLGGFLTPLNLPESNCGCGDHFQCCTRGDFLLFEIAKGACDTFMEDNHPYVDTIPLYLVKDGPGTSTVDPADPNLIYAVLRNDMLIIRDFTGVKIFLTLSRNGSLFSPRRARSVQAQQSFTDSTSVELTEEGTYDIELTSESWNYIVVGSFDFNKTHEAVEIIPSERPAASKILRNGQLLIRIGDQLYTPSGVMVQ